MSEWEVIELRAIWLQSQRLAAELSTSASLSALKIIRNHIVASETPAGAIEHDAWIREKHENELS